MSITKTNSNKLKNAIANNTGHMFVSKLNLRSKDSNNKNSTSKKDKFKKRIASAV